MLKSNLREVLAENIRSYRRQKKISQDAFADQCGLHRTYIGALERCERNVTLSTLELVAKAVGISVPDLLSKEKIK